MSFMEWNDKLEISVPEIDEQHKILVGYVNKLHDASRTDKGDEVVGPIISGLVNYTVYHFFAEEGLMEKNGFPEYEQHRKEHLELTEKTMDFFTDYHAEKGDIVNSLCAFLREWLTGHIMVSDVKLASFLKGRGAAL